MSKKLSHASYLPIVKEFNDLLKKIILTKPNILNLFQIYYVIVLMM